MSRGLDTRPGHCETLDRPISAQLRGPQRNPLLPPSPGQLRSCSGCVLQSLDLWVREEALPKPSPPPYPAPTHLSLTLPGEPPPELSAPAVAALALGPRWLSNPPLSLRFSGLHGSSASTSELWSVLDPEKQASSWGHTHNFPTSYPEVWGGVVSRHKSRAVKEA